MKQQKLNSTNSAKVVLSILIASKSVAMKKKK